MNNVYSVYKENKMNNKIKALISAVLTGAILGGVVYNPELAVKIISGVFLAGGMFLLIFLVIGMLSD